MSQSTSLPGGVWSAVPTPFTLKWGVDVESVERMVDHDRRLGISGYFVCGSNGEGAWLTQVQQSHMLKAVVRFNKGRIPVAFQVTDNSAGRILDNMRRAADEGADIAVISPPFFHIHANDRTLLALYLEAIRKSPLPVGIYDRGLSGSVPLSGKVLETLYLEPKVVMCKDSSADMARLQIALAAKKRRPEMILLNGWEFNCLPYLNAGFDGLLLGGGVFNGAMAAAIMAAHRRGAVKAAEHLQSRMNRMMYAVYGGKKISCWLAGEKHLLVRMGIFKTSLNLLGYELTPACESAIERLLVTEREFLEYTP